MKHFITKYLIVLLLFIPEVLQAQENMDRANEKAKIRRQFYGILYHQHHDFFDKAFSFQGLEAGLIVNQNVYLGIYGSCFVSTLVAEVNDKIQFIWIGQKGMQVGFLYQSGKRIHLGIQLNAGHFSLRMDDDRFGVFHVNEAKFKLQGFVLYPQIFGEFEITKWFKIRTGLLYNSYHYQDHSVVSNSDLDHLSFTFGLAFVSN